MTAKDIIIYERYSYRSKRKYGKAEMHIDTNSFVRPTGEGANGRDSSGALGTPEHWTRIDRINENVTNSRNSLPTPFKQIQ